MRPCNICSELAGSADSPFANIIGRGIVGAIFAQTREFRIIPSLGPLVVGHSLLVSTMHMTSICALMGAPGLMNQVSTLVAKFANSMLLDDNTELFCFEHGSLDETDEPLCSTTHAHLHLVPLRSKTVQKILSQQFLAQTHLLGADQITHAVGNCRRYLFACSAGRDGEMQKGYVRDAEGLESQFMRRVIARELGLGSGDWKTSPNTPALERTLSLGFQQLSLRA